MADERTPSREEDQAVWDVLTDGEPEAQDRAQELATEILENPEDPPLDNG